MYIEAVPNRDSPPAILLRESYREAGKVKKRTLLNLSDWPHERIAGFKALLKGGTVIPKDQDAITIIRSLPHGHVDAALGTARKIGLDRLLGPDGNRCRDLILALVVSRILDPSSKLAAARALSPDTATSSLGEQLALGVVDEDELYSALDWLAVRQPACESAWNKDPVSGVIGIQSGPPGRRVHNGFHGEHGGRVGDANRGDDCQGSSGLFHSQEADQGDLPRASPVAQSRAQGDSVGSDRVSLRAASAAVAAD